MDLLLLLTLPLVTGLLCRLLPRQILDGSG